MDINNSIEIILIFYNLKYIVKLLNIFIINTNNGKLVNIIIKYYY